MLNLAVTALVLLFSNYYYLNYFLAFFLGHSFLKLGLEG